jgi:hypothetical protein
MNLKQLIKFGMEESQEPVIKNPVLRQALEPRTMDLAEGGRIGFADGPPGTIKKATGPTKKNVGDTSPVYNAETGHIHKRTNRWGTVYSNVDDTAARKKGRIQRDITLKLVKKDGTINVDAIRENLIKNKKKVTMVNNQFIFADEKLQQEFLDDMILRYKYPKTSTKAKQAGVKSNKQIFEKYFEGTYSESGVHDLINRFKKELGETFNKLPPSEREAHKLRREAKLLISQAGKRISGLDEFPSHHLFPIGDEFEHGTQDFTIIDKKTNSQLSGPNKKLVELAEQRSDLINDIQTGKINIKEFDIEIGKLDNQAQTIIDGHYKKFPNHDGLLNWRKAGSMVDDQGRFMDIVSKGTIGGDTSKWSVTDVNKKIKDLSQTELKIFRSDIKNIAMNPEGQIKLLRNLGYGDKCKASGGRVGFAEGNVATGELQCILDDVQETKKEARKGNPTAINKQRKAFNIGKDMKGFGKILRRGIQMGTSAITTPLKALGLTSWAGYAIEGLIEGGIYDFYKRQGYSDEQAFAETFTPRLAKEALEGKSTEDVPWYGGAEELIEKEKIGTRWDPSGKVNLAAKYADAKSKYDEAVEKYYEIQGSIKPTTLEQAEEKQAALAEQEEIIRALEPSIKAGTPEYEAYQIAEERQAGLMDERRRAYLEKTDPKFLEREEKSFDIYGRDREGNILYEKMTSPFKKRYKEMDEWKGGRDAFTIKPGEYIDWAAYGLDDEEGMKEKWRQIYEQGGMDLLDRIAVAGGVSNLAEGGIASLNVKK